MKIVVTVKQVPDPNVSPGLDPDNTVARERESVLDPGDECGIEIALQLKEAAGEGEVVLCSMGPGGARDAIRKGLSMGADRGILVTDSELEGADALLTARTLAAAIAPESPDLVITATESYDGSTGVVPPMLAELLHLPQLTFATRLQAQDGRLTVHRQTADGYQVVEAEAPALVSVTAAIAEPRYASLKGIMAARRKEVKELAFAELGIDKGDPVEEILSVDEAEERSAGEIVEDDGTSGVDRILEVLAQARVI
ncbi:MAG: electron transfer flavoprotein subunit beta/FixA family protein [Candidatus Dormibacteraeota bacterium]|nr:electron transfer flavoprotein subunit beta/FixA family protein [Candidatus Dormibacteraeota bacterium]MBO0744593.1 electron transfer flavoprotein subunit beta/FixA family protein [Candidatus Dormibacteraeota bacterium]